MLASALLKQNITVPAEIQSAVIPGIMNGRDVVATSPTGTGKTLAYLLPVINRLDNSPETHRRAQALILAPTYELAAQIHAQSCLLWENAGLDGTKPVLLIGGAGISRQIDALKEKPRIVIGSAGRVSELIALKKLSAHFIKTVVLDEFDRLIDKDNAAHLNLVLKAIPKNRQMLLFSATGINDKEVLNNYTSDPVFIDINTGNKKSVPKSIRHRAIICERRDKFARLRGLIHADKVTKALLFLNNAGNAARTAERLNHHGVSAIALSAGMTSQERKAAISSLREGQVTIIAATDAAARGLDVDGLTHVIHMEPPKTAGDYLHRSGRTGRMNAEGASVTLATEQEMIRLESIARALGIQIRCSYKEG